MFFKEGKASSKNAGANNKEVAFQLPVIKLGMDFINDQGTSIHRQMGVSFLAGNSFDFDKHLGKLISFFVF